MIMNVSIKTHIFSNIIHEHASSNLKTLLISQPGIEGETDKSGLFEYKEGDSIRLSLGSHNLVAEVAE